MKPETLRKKFKNDGFTQHHFHKTIIKVIYDFKI